MKLGVIPARGGSKRIPHKNIKEFCGKPIIAWSIETLLATKVFDRIIVSTDCPEIAQVAETYGAEVPFMRPDALSDDFSPTVPVVQHAIREMQQQSGKMVDQVCCIYPTAPLAEPKYILQAFETLESSAEVDMVFTTTSFPFPIQRALLLDQDGGVTLREPEHEMTRSQDLVECYHDAGQFYCWKGQACLNNTGYYTNARGLVLPRKKVVDIDTQEDWNLAEILFKAQ